MKYCLRGTRQLYDVSEGHERISASVYRARSSYRCRYRTDHRRLFFLLAVYSLGRVRSIPSNRVSFSLNATRSSARSPADGPVDAQRGAKKFRKSATRGDEVSLAARLVETANDGGNKAKERRGEELKGWRSLGSLKSVNLRRGWSTRRQGI